MKCVVLIALAVLVLQCDSKIFTKCELVRELRSQGFPEDKLRDWVCLVVSESGGRTDIVGRMNSNGSRDYGLFQINDKYWCNNPTKPGKDVCHVDCTDLLTDNITKAAKCAKLVYKRQGFQAWYGWKNHCQKSLPDISSC